MLCSLVGRLAFTGDRDRDWDQDWHRDRDRDWGRNWDRDWERDRDRDQNWDRDRDWDRPWERDRLRERDRLQEWDRRGRSRDLEFRERWPYTRSPRRSKSCVPTRSLMCLHRCRGLLLQDAFPFPGFPQRDLSLPVMEKTTLAMGRGYRRRSLMMEYEPQSQVCLGFLSSWKGCLHFTAERPSFPPGCVPLPLKSHLGGGAPVSPRRDPRPVPAGDKWPGWLLPVS